MDLYQLAKFPIFFTKCLDMKLQSNIKNLIGVRDICIYSHIVRYEDCVLYNQIVSYSLWLLLNI